MHAAGEPSTNFVHAAPGRQVFVRNDSGSVLQPFQANAADTAWSPAGATSEAPHRYSSIPSLVPPGMDAVGIAMYAIPLRSSKRACLQGNGICLGATVSGGPGRRPIISQITYDYAPQIRALISALRKDNSLPEKFMFSSIQLNSGVCDWHEDAGNVGASWATARGKFYGGGLRFRLSGACLDIWTQGYIFDGANTHCTEAFDGSRRVTVLFTHSTAPNLSKKDIAFLESPGFSCNHDPAAPFLEAIGTLALVRLSFIGTLFL